MRGGAGARRPPPRGSGAARATGDAPGTGSGREVRVFSFNSVRESADPVPGESTAIPAELLDVDWEVFGDRDPDSMRESGGRNVVAMQRASRYQRLEYRDRGERPRNVAELVSQV